MDKSQPKGLFQMGVPKTEVLVQWIYCSRVLRRNGSKRRRIRQEDKSAKLCSQPQTSLSLIPRDHGA